MNWLTVTLAVLPSLLLITFHTSTAKSNKAGCVGRYCSTIQCPGSYNCSCVRNPTGDYELLCPNVMEPSVLSVSIMPEVYIQIQCTFTTHWRDYDLLKGLQVGPVAAVNFRLCPLPNMSLEQLTKSLGINKTTSLLFQSYRNLSNTLERRHLMGLENIKRLLLSSNGLTELPSDLLQDLNNLTWLDLRGNNVYLHKTFFQPVPNLETLELGNNNIKSLEPGIFSNLTKLRTLNLWKNQLQNLTRSVFTNLTSLTSLDVNSNGIVTLPSDIFHDLTNLEIVGLFANNFTFVPEGLLTNNKNLQVLRFYNNHQTLKRLPEKFLSNLTRLREVYMMKNNITYIPENCFWGSNKMMNLSLSGNLLKTLPHKLFQDLKELKTLDVSYNQLMTLPDNLFKDLQRLESLRLEYNQLEVISKYTLAGLRNLELLDLEHNRLHHIHDDSFTHLTSLKQARLSHNKLSFMDDDLTDDNQGIKYLDVFGNRSPLQYCTNLETLYLANNTITEIFSDWTIVLIQLRILDLSYNSISTLNSYDMQFLSTELSVDLRYNNISTIYLNGLEELATSQKYEDVRTKRNIRILLEENPLNCDCQVYELFSYFEKKLKNSLDFVSLIPGNLKCKSPAEFADKSVSVVKSEELTCMLGPNDSPAKPCPHNCTCRVRIHDLALIVNCSNQHLHEYPQQLPTVNYTNHTKLILSNNLLSEFPNLNSVEYKKVTHLYLSNNNITNVNVEELRPDVRVLELDNNNLTRFEDRVVEYLRNKTRITRMTLHNNPWQCLCQDKNMINFIQTKYKQIPHLSNVTCYKDGRKLSELSSSDLCPVSTAVIVASVIVAVLGVTLGALAALYYRYQREVKVWLYAHRLCLWFVTEEELDKDKIYDAFVSFSHKDEEFVVDTLVPGLESGQTPFKLCLHYRDWIAGEWIPNQIARSVEDSRRTLVVLSPNFLESVWGRMEFRAAHKQALSEGRARVIVILYGDVGDTEELDPELKAYISMNTYVKWGDPWFWNKLRYALPHPPYLVKGNGQLLKRRGSRREKNFIDDKLELIHTLDSPTTPPGATTPPAETPVTNGGAKYNMNGHAKHIM